MNVEIYQNIYTKVFPNWFTLFQLCSKNIHCNDKDENLVQTKACKMPLILSISLVYFKVILHEIKYFDILLALNQYEIDCNISVAMCLCGPGLTFGGTKNAV